MGCFEPCDVTLIEFWISPPSSPLPPGCQRRWFDPQCMAPLCRIPGHTGIQVNGINANIFTKDPILGSIDQICTSIHQMHSYRYIHQTVMLYRPNPYSFCSSYFLETESSLTGYTIHLYLSYGHQIFIHVLYTKSLHMF
jgi:hypothetical protein